MFINYRILFADTLDWFDLSVIVSSPSTIPILRDVKMGFNPWVNPAHPKFEPNWVEKNSVFFFKIGLNSTRLT